MMNTGDDRSSGLRRAAAECAGAAAFCGDCCAIVSTAAPPVGALWAAGGLSIAVAKRDFLIPHRSFIF
jgi:hypothetical protein